MALTKAQRARLDKLATYLEGLPADYAHFDMSHWILADDRPAELRYARKNGGVPACGTAACAAGHGPAAGVLVPARFIAFGFSVNWYGYSKLFAPAGRDNAWCFDGVWENVDNHHHGAAARIRYLLANGCPPPGFDLDQFDDAIIGRALIALYAPYRIDAKAKANA